MDAPRILLSTIPEQQQRQQQNCAINLYGLPRSFKHHVLPSLVENVLKPNMHYGCDYFVHFFNKTTEASSRSGKGGYIDANEVFLLQGALKNAIKNKQTPPCIKIISDTDEDFFRDRQATIYQIQNYPQLHNKTRNPYYPTTNSSGFDASSTINILKMWHSQTRVFELMEAQKSHKYTRVAMLRLDVIYMTPIDIYRVPNDPTRNKYPSINKEQGTYWKRPLPGPITKSDYYFFDLDNHHAVIPGFASFPINDRFIMGPYDAVKIWATQRWNHMDHYIHSTLKKRTALAKFGLHDERFLAFDIVPRIRQGGTKLMVDRNLYFFRVRADGSIWILDCPFADAKYNEPKKLEVLLQRRCMQVQKSSNHVAPLYVKCPPLAPLEEGGTT
jgi:hypothetical protein